MYKTSKNGLWRLYYLGMSKVGQLLYKLCETISKSLENFILKKLKLKRVKRYPTLAILINLFTYIGAIFLITLGYDKLCGKFVINSNTDINTLIGGDEGFFEYIMVKVSFIRIIFEMNSEYGGHFSFSSFFVSVVLVIVMWSLLIVINTLYFSIIYGFLKEKLVEVDLLQKFIKKPEPNISEVSVGKKEHNLNHLLTQIKKAIRDWAESQTVISNLFNNKKVLLIFIPLMFTFSSVMYITGIYKASLMSTVIEIVDSINLFNIVISFAITYLGTKGAQKGGAYVISIAPEVIRNGFEYLSEKAGLQAQEFEDARHQWAEDNDLVKNQNDTRSSRGSGVTRGQGQRQTNPLERKREFDNELEARKFLEDEFRRNIRELSDNEFDKVIDMIDKLIPPSLKEIHVFSPKKSATDTTPNKIIAVANFYIRQPDLITAEEVRQALRI